MTDWLANLPETGLREMCSWERYCAFAREPETRKVGPDARVQVGGAYYEVDPDLAGEEVLLWWGLFDHQLFVEWRGTRFGLYHPHGGPIPLHRYRRPRASAREKRADTIAALAERIELPREAVSGALQPAATAQVVPLPRVTFADPDPWGEIAYASTLSARRAIADQLRRPLGELGREDLDSSPSWWAGRWRSARSRRRSGRGSRTRAKGSCSGLRSSARGREIIGVLGSDYLRPSGGSGSDCVRPGAD